MGYFVVIEFDDGVFDFDFMGGGGSYGVDVEGVGGFGVDSVEGGRWLDV